MAFKLVFAIFSCLVAHNNICEAGKAFGGVGGPGGAGGFGGFGGYANIQLINQQRWKLIAAQTECSNAVNTTNTTIQNDIAAAQNTIDQAVLASQNKAQGVENQQCLQQHSAALAQVNSESVKLCDQAAELLAIENQQAQLATCHSSISVCYGMCPMWAAPDCITNCLSGSDTQIDTLRTSILDGCTKAKTDAAQCVQQTTAGALSAIAAADKNLNSCASPAA